MNKLWAMYFSGTGGTEKVTKSIAETIGSKLNIHNIEYVTNALAAVFEE